MKRSFDLDFDRLDRSAPLVSRILDFDATAAKLIRFSDEKNLASRFRSGTILWWTFTHNFLRGSLFSEKYRCKHI